MEVTVNLLKNAMLDTFKSEKRGEGWDDHRGRFLIDGFPRKMDQALKFEEVVRAVPLSVPCHRLTCICRSVLRL